MPISRTAAAALCAAACLIVVPQRGSAQGPPPTSKSTRDGVYTAAQAARGKEVYAGFCQACHTPASHTGSVFTSKWVGWPISELFSYLRNEMPQSDPGSLSAAEYADVLTYILQLNGLPKGTEELPRDVKALKEIRFDTAAARPRRPERR